VPPAPHECETIRPPGSGPFIHLVGEPMKKRHLWQISSLVLLNLPFLGEWKMVCMPVLNCHSCPWAVFACPIGVLGHFALWGVIPLLALGTILMLGALFGRVLCGWVCPFGFLQDLLYKISSPKWRIPHWMAYTKYLLLAGTVFLVPILFGINNYAFFCKLCPAGSLESLFPRALIEGNVSALYTGIPRIAVLVVVLVWAVFSSRVFCKVFCPIGAILALFNRLSGFSIKYSQGSCSDCSLCLKHCPMDVQLEDFQKTAGDSVLVAPSECILCLDCTDNCHKSGLKFSFWNLKREKAADPPESRWRSLEE
jgi:ferredoxin-type protein NapH